MRDYTILNSWIRQNPNISFILESGRLQFLEERHYSFNSPNNKKTEPRQNWHLFVFLIPNKKNNEKTHFGSTLPETDSKTPESWWLVQMIHVLFRTISAYFQGRKPGCSFQGVSNSQWLRPSSRESMVVSLWQHLAAVKCTGLMGGANVSPTKGWGLCVLLFVFLREKHTQNGAQTKLISTYISWQDSHICSYLAVK